VRRYAWHVTHPLDLAAMSEALAPLIGTHDFKAFQAAGSRVSDTIRTLYEASLEEYVPEASWPGPGGASELTLVLRGDGFLRHMVRNIVGTLVEIGRGRWPPGQMAAVLASRDRRLAGPTAPPQGLFLVEVEY
jgi:tRNA pseudouridine38-40 synthase